MENVEGMNESYNHTIGQLIEPEPIGFNFGAPGWIILGIILLIGIFIYGIIRFIRHQRNKYRREALTQIEVVRKSGLELPVQLYKAAETIKNVALISYGRKQQAELYGQAWLEFLKEKNKGNKIFSAQVEPLYIQSLYKGKLADITKSDLESFFDESINWIKTHYV